MSQQRSSKKPGLYYIPRFVKLDAKDEIFSWLKTLYPIWENRYSEHHPPPEGDHHRRLLRPIYWLGNWQFACLGYYHPPEGIHQRAIKAGSFPPIIAEKVKHIEHLTRQHFRPSDIPKGWHLNTCLINYYGDQLTDDYKKIDTARVGDHKDFEPGPVASISFGERALFQFVRGKAKEDGNVYYEQWLDDSSLLIFGGELYKNQLFHRVQRVDRKNKSVMDLNTPQFETRRLNFTFRYVPLEHYCTLQDLPVDSFQDILPYVQELAKTDPFWEKSLREIKR